MIPVALFVPVVTSFFIESAESEKWPEYIGIFFHLAVLPLVARLSAPEWGKAAGYGWLTVDIVVGVLAINDVTAGLTEILRLGGHVCAGVWIITSSLCSRSWPIRIVYTLTGVWLAGYSFVAPVTPSQLLTPASLLAVVWFALHATFPADPANPDETADLTSLRRR